MKNDERDREFRITPPNRAFRGRTKVTRSNKILRFARMIAVRSVKANGAG